ncbi:MAG: alanine dehydrogenase [Actinobacteria bacterium]|nr:alanine dehydrogenase [Actinomycetota bacterium]PLS87583.1 MAG: alanine dehydrogenase [Actinomycetota bacterium]
MRVGVVRELTPGEGRVALTPHAVHELARAGHRVYVEAGAGEGAAVPDEDYRAAGARVVSGAEGVWRDSELVAKVFGPLPEEYGYLREDLIVFAFLSLAVNGRLLKALLDSRCAAFSMEAIGDGRGGLPILTPMSEIAGHLVPQVGAHYLQRPFGGRGILLGGAAGVRPGRVVVLGAGIVGTGAARVASGLGAEVVVVDRDMERLRRVEAMRFGGVTTLAASSMGIREVVPEADLLIGAILVVDSRTPHLVDRGTVRAMREGSVIVDVDVDQGGCVETSRPTTLREPTFVEEGVTHYCVKNVPAAVPVTAARALSNALVPHVARVAGRGLVDALNAAPGLARGASVVEGRLVSPSLAREHAIEHHHLKSVLPLHAEAR